MRSSPSISPSTTTSASAGLAREVVRLVQDLRKSSGLDVADHIRLSLAGLDDLAPLFDAIGREVLAVEITAGPPPTASSDGSGAGPGDGTALDLDDRPGAVAWIEKV